MQRRARTGALQSWLGGSLLLGALTACGTGVPAVQAPVPSAQPVVAKPLAPREQLLSALRAVERPPPVLDLLAEPALSVLDTRLKALTLEQREQLVSGELAEVMPLLHLRAGGGLARALFSLATTPAATQELPLVFEGSASTTDEERRRVVQATRELARRTALHFLRDRVIDLSGAEPAGLGRLLSSIERAAQAAERPDLQRLALVAWAEVDPLPDVLVKLAEAHAFALDLAGVRAVVQRLPKDSLHHPTLVTVLAAAGAASSADPLAKAWGLLGVGRYTEVGPALASLARRAPEDLRVAAALAVAAAEGSACPGLQPGIGSARLCAIAMKVRPQLGPALGAMERAWQSKAGRDAASVEAYLGLAHVVPWVTEMSLASDALGLERDFTRRYEALSRAVAELPEQRALGVFAAALSAGVRAGLHARPGERPRIDPAEKQALATNALRVALPAPRLAVAAVLASDQSISALLPASAPARLAGALSGLLAWEAASSLESGALEAARSALAERLTTAPAEGAERPAAVLLLAELDAVATPSERSYRALAQVGSQLIGEPLPPELALRAVLDTAGALERLGRTADALGVLRQAAEIEAVPGPAADLLWLIRAEKLVLEWDRQRDPARKTLARELALLRARVSSPSLAVLFELWSNPKALRQGQKKPKEVLEERLGARGAELMSRGALRATRVSLRVAYTFRTGITPEVMFEPMLVPLVGRELIQKAL